MQSCIATEVFSLSALFPIDSPGRDLSDMKDLSDLFAPNLASQVGSCQVKVSEMEAEMAGAGARGRMLGYNVPIDLYT